MAESKYQRDVIDAGLNLQLEADVEQRGRQIAYYLDQLADELSEVMLYTSGETFSWLRDSASRVGAVAAQEAKLAELD